MAKVIEFYKQRDWRWIMAKVIEFYKRPDLAPKRELVPVNQYARVIMFPTRSEKSASAWPVDSRFTLSFRS